MCPCVRVVRLFSGACAVRVLFVLFARQRETGWGRTSLEQDTPRTMAAASGWRGIFNRKKPIKPNDMKKCNFLRLERTNAPGGECVSLARLLAPFTLARIWVKQIYITKYVNMRCKLNI